MHVMKSLLVFLIFTVLISCSSSGGGGSKPETPPDNNTVVLDIEFAPGVLESDNTFAMGANNKQLAFTVKNDEGIPVAGLKVAVSFGSTRLTAVDNVSDLLTFQPSTLVTGADGSGAVTVINSYESGLTSRSGYIQITVDAAKDNASSDKRYFNIPASVRPKLYIYTVSFSNTGISDMQVTEGSLLTEPTDPLKDNATFAGWFKEPTLNNQWNFLTDKVNSNITLYPRWINALIDSSLVMNVTTMPGVMRTELFTIETGSALSATQNLPSGMSIIIENEMISGIEYTYMKVTTVNLTGDKQLVDINLVNEGGQPYQKTLELIYEDGSAITPYMIYNEAELRLVNTAGLNKHYRLGDNITLSSAWTPIGRYVDVSGGNPVYSYDNFTGTFDGDDYNITGMSIGIADAPDNISNMGMFVSIDNGTVTDLHLKNVQIYAGNGAPNVGGIAGTMTGGRLENVSVEGFISGGSAAGGLVGQIASKISDVVVTRSYVKLDYTGQGGGGLFGYVNYRFAIDAASFNVNISRCYGVVSIANTTSSGGFASKAGAKVTISDCYLLADLTGNSMKGFVDESKQATGVSIPLEINNCYIAGTINGGTSSEGFGVSATTTKLNNNIALLKNLGGYRVTSSSSNANAVNNYAFKYSLNNGAIYDWPVANANDLRRNGIDATIDMINAPMSSPLSVFGANYLRWSEVAWDFDKDNRSYKLPVLRGVGGQQESFITPAFLTSAGTLTHEGSIDNLTIDTIDHTLVTYMKDAAGDPVVGKEVKLVWNKQASADAVPVQIIPAVAVTDSEGKISVVLKNLLSTGSVSGSFTIWSNYLDDTDNNTYKIYERRTPAIFSVAPTYNINIGGATNTAAKGSYITVPANPTQSGKLFAGWYTDETYTKQWNFATDKVMDNVTLYAKWNDDDPSKVVLSGKVIITKMRGVSRISPALVPGGTILSIEAPAGFGYTLSPDNTSVTFNVSGSNVGALFDVQIRTTTGLVIAGLSVEDGSESAPYIIENEAALRQINNRAFNYENLTKHYRLAANIDLDGVDWTPLGALPAVNEAYPFAGKFNGDNFTIKNLVIDSTDDSYLGFFGYILGKASDNAVVKNLVFDNITIKGANYVGAVAGYTDNTTIENVGVINSSIVGASASSNYVGGLIGNMISASSIKRSYARNTDVSGYNVGGIVGQIDNTTAGGVHIDKSYYDGNLNSTGYTGGIVGYVAKRPDRDNTTISNCYTSGTYRASMYAAGISGYYGRVQSSYSTALLMATSGAALRGSMGIGSVTSAVNCIAINGYMQTKWNSASATLARISNNTYAPLNSNNYSVYIRADNYTGDYAWPDNLSLNGTTVSMYDVLDKSVFDAGKLNWDTDVWELNPTGTYKLPVLKGVGGQDQLGNPAHIENPVGRVKLPDTMPTEITLDGEDYEFTIIIRDVDGNPVPNAAVNITSGNPNVNLYYSDTADADGKVTIRVVNRNAGTEFHGTMNLSVQYTNSKGNAETVTQAVNYLAQQLYKVSFSGQDITVPEQYLIKDKLALKPLNVVRAGYIFGGWYTNASFEANTRWDFTEDKVTADVNLYGKWVPYTATPTDISMYITTMEGVVRQMRMGAPSGATDGNIIVDAPDGITGRIDGDNLLITADCKALLGSVTEKPLFLIKTAENEIVYRMSFILEEGTAGNPYLINNEGELLLIDYSANNRTAYYKLIKDLVLSDNFTQVSGNPSLKFDGDNHTISGLKQDAIREAGLFKRLGDNAVVKNLVISNVSITGRSGGGILSAIAGNNVVIENIHVSGTVVSTFSGYDSKFGGLIGTSSPGTTIDRCSAAVDIQVSGATNVGGIVGSFMGNSITRSYVTGRIQGLSGVGGIVGYNNNSSTKLTIENCYSTADVIATGSDSQAGGIIGNCMRYPIIKNSYSTGKVSSTSGSTTTSGSGGIAGFVYDTSVTVDFTNNIALNPDIANASGVQYQIANPGNKAFKGYMNNYAFDGIKQNNSLVPFPPTAVGQDAIDFPEANVKMATKSEILDGSVFGPSKLNWDLTGVWEVDTEAAYPLPKLRGLPGQNHAMPAHLRP